jgi:hypothetical protein
MRFRTLMFTRSERSSSREPSTSTTAQNQPEYSGSLACKAKLEGFGTSPLLSRTVSIHSEMASLLFSMA